MKKNDKCSHFYRIFVLLIIAGFIFGGCATKEKEKEIEPELKVWKKYALVIGNNNYGAYAKLKNSINDARDISSVLEQFDYKVELCIDINLEEMELKIEEFAGYLSEQKDTQGFFYFAGMGARIKGKNYMIPTAIKASNEEQLISGSYELSKLFEKLIEAGNDVNIVISDACFSSVTQANQRAAANKTQGTGSGKIISSEKINDDGLELLGQFSSDIFYFQSALPGKDAFDGEGRNSPFTGALLSNLSKPQKLTDLVQEIINDTRTNSGGSQRPYFKANVFNFEDYIINQYGIPEKYN